MQVVVSWDGEAMCLFHFVQGIESTRDYAKSLPITKCGLLLIDENMVGISRFHSVRKDDLHTLM